MSVKLERDVVGMIRETIHFKDRGQVTIPKEIVEQLGLKKGDILECVLEDGKIVLVPAIAVPKDQAWFWTDAWQSEEHEVDAQKERGEVGKPMELDEAVSVLDRMIKEK